MCIKRSLGLTGRIGLTTGIAFAEQGIQLKKEVLESDAASAKQRNVIVSNSNGLGMDHIFIS